ncbi:MAG TPA: cytochrome B [Flavobacteriales bacterium]|jgi:hypothetical protein|nr:hypothetical protein [Flavobacteriales bacterium]HAW20151.1 cytochrome B [Flavobacteriales bacterium]
MIIGLSHLHSSLRYVVLIFLFLAILDAILAVSSDKPYAKTSKLFALITLISAHIQLLLGLALYFIGDKGFKIITSVEGFMSIAPARFFAMEHISGMILAIVLITVGYSKAKKKEMPKQKYSTILLFYGISLLIIFAMIPWPFMKDFGSWI